MIPPSSPVELFAPYRDLCTRCTTECTIVFSTSLARTRYLHRVYSKHAEPFEGPRRAYHTERVYTALTQFHEFLKLIQMQRARFLTEHIQDVLFWQAI